MSRKTETLAKIGLFRSLPPEKVDLLDTQCFWHRAPANQWIIDYQDTNNDVFFVISGTLRVKIQSVSGREVLLREINAGDFFGEIAAIDKKPRSAGILAVTDVSYARMPASVFLTAVHSSRDVCDQLLERLAGYVRSMSNRVNEFSTLDARHRIYSELLRLSRPDAAKPTQAVVSPPPVHADLAARVSIRRESVSRELKALERAGLLEKRRGAMVLTDTARLRKMIAEASEVE
ncbi:MAG TPA: Crp/Fnr family transcriptional regulator [Xanthobacteraceae bacterium]|jgi:CRP-like cAMP-binding protein